MKAAGGAVNLKKTVWWLVDFQWQHGCWKVKTCAQNPVVLFTKDKCEHEQTIPRKEFNQEQKILSVFLAPKSTSKKKTKVL